VSSNNDIFYDNSGLVYKLSNTLVPTSGQTPLDPDFDGALIAVLTNLANGDKVIFGANGAVASATFNAAPTAAKITGAFGGTNALILEADTSSGGGSVGAFAIPAGKTLTVGASGVLKLSATSGTLTITGTLLVDKDGTDKVTIIDAVITPSSAAETLGDGSTGSVIVATSKVELASGGSIAAAGAGTFTVGTSTNTFVLTDGTITAGGAETLVASATAAAAGTVALAADASAIGLLGDGTLAVAGTGSLTVGPAAKSVKLENATVTAATGVSNPNVAKVASGEGTITLAAGDTLAFIATGKITTAGTGKLVAGATTFGGAGTWTASLGSNATSITITSSANGAVITAPSGTAASALTATGTPVITQNSGSGNTLTLTGFVTIALAGTNASPAGSIVLVADSTPANGGKITFSDANSLITTANANGSPTALAGTNGLAIGGKTIVLNTMTYAAIYGDGGNGNPLSKIGGASGDMRPNGSTAVTDDVTLAANIVVVGAAAG
jgi:hypothetical protein